MIRHVGLYIKQQMLRPVLMTAHGDMVWVEVVKMLKFGIRK